MPPHGNRSAHRRSPWLVRLALAMALAVVLVAPLMSTHRPVARSAAVTMSTTDRLLAPPRGTPEKVARFAEARSATRPLEARRYIDEVYRLAPLVGLDPAVVVAQSALETASWTSRYWTDHLNPAGIRITSTGVPSHTWATGTAAARYHLVHLYIYAAGAIDPGHPLYPYRTDGPGYQNAVNLGYGGQARTIADLTGRWAVDPDYATKIVSRGNGIFAAASDDPTDPRVIPIGAQGTVGGLARDAIDGDSTSVWAVIAGGGPPTEAQLTIDLGRAYRLSSVRWRFGLADHADAWVLDASHDGASWTPLASYGNAPVNTWQVHLASDVARYVRFTVANPNSDAALGGIAEVEVYGMWAEGSPPARSTPHPIPTATRTPIPSATPTTAPSRTSTPLATTTIAPATATPLPSPASLGGIPLTVVGSGGSAIGSPSRAVRDGSLRTTWQTTSAMPPRQAQVSVDLGRVRAITGVEWVFRRTSGAAAYRIETSTDRVRWTPVSSHAGSTPLRWQRVAAGRAARYVRFRFDNPTSSPSLGYLAEVRVYGEVAAAGSVAEPTPLSGSPAVATSSPTATHTPMPTPAMTPSATPTVEADEQASPVLDAATPEAIT